MFPSDLLSNFSVDGEVKQGAVTRVELHSGYYFATEAEVSPWLSPEYFHATYTIIHTNNKGLPLSSAFDIDQAQVTKSIRTRTTEEKRQTSVCAEHDAIIIAALTSPTSTFHCYTTPVQRTTALVLVHHIITNTATAFPSN